MSHYREIMFILSRKERNIQTSGQNCLTQYRRVQKAYLEDKSLVSDSCYPIGTSTIIHLINQFNSFIRDTRSLSLPFIFALLSLTKRSEKMAVYYLKLLWRETKSLLSWVVNQNMGYTSSFPYADSAIL